jgi:YidC/Oxa1 family membrane protein insertase
MVLAVLVLAGQQIIYSLFFAPQRPPARPPAKVARTEAQQAKPREVEPAKLEAGKDQPDAAAVAPADAAAGKGAPAGQPKDTAADQKAPVAAPPIESRRLALGSGDPRSPYRMLVYLTNDGAAIERLEMNSPHYRDLESRSGHLGYLAPIDAPQRSGALVRVVGAGTPAAAAGLKTGDVITAIGKQKIATAADLITALRQTEPGASIRVTIRRNDAARELTAELGWQPLAVIRAEYESEPVEVVRPGNHDPLSFLMTIQQFDDEIAPDDSAELKGLDMRGGPWEIVAANETVASFRKELPKLGLQVTKTFRLEKVPPDQAGDSDYPAYSVLLDVSVANVGDAAHRVAYRLDGPTGLPIEGEWYAIKVSRTWGAAGLRDIVARFQGGTTTQVSTAKIAAPDFATTWSNTPLYYIAVDAQYFAAALIPQKKNPDDVWFAEVKPIRVGAVPADKSLVKLTDVSFRLTTEPAELAPGSPPLEHHFQIFAGPKKPALLAQYVVPGTNVTLGELVYYGWFGFVAKPMLAILHTFYTVVGNYGLAIIMLTVLVRVCMFPLSRKQALSAQKMQELQPEIKRIHEKYKNDAEKKMRAQQQLFREHNYHPLGGCLLAFVQLPIFVGLYRSLSVDVELRQAPLFSDQIRWASDLAAPDMFWNWSSVMPQFITHGTGFFALGPYLNILPLVTIALFIWQQKMFMPPPADEQAALQQKMMQYMMIVMGFLFFKVASGLCVYFIASSIWGIAERKLLPKTAAPSQPGGGATVAAPAASGNGAAFKKKRQKGRK